MSGPEACAYYGVDDFELEDGISAGEICDQYFELNGDCEHTEERIMADLYQRTCMKCDVHTDCYAYEDGFICMECFDKEQGFGLGQCDYCEKPAITKVNRRVSCKDCIEQCMSDAFKRIKQFKSAMKNQ